MSLTKTDTMVVARRVPSAGRSPGQGERVGFPTFVPSGPDGDAAPWRAGSSRQPATAPRMNMWFPFLSS